MRLGLELYEVSRVDKIVEKGSMRHNCTSENLTIYIQSMFAISTIEYVILELDSLHMNVLPKDKIKQLMNGSHELIC